MKRKRSEAEWNELFSEQKGSGKSVRDFCQLKGLNENMFYRKRKLLSERSELVRLPISLNEGTGIELSVGVVKVEVAKGFREEELVRVLRCVREALDV